MQDDVSLKSPLSDADTDIPTLSYFSIYNYFVELCIHVR